MDASQYKDYILTLLFLKYVSDKSEADPDALIEIPSGCSFDDIVALKGNKEIGTGIDGIIGQLANVNGLRGVIDVTSFNDPEKLGKGREMIERLSKLVAIFDELDFRASRAGGDDLLGDAYEYLMRHFATESGKSKGQFYTPGEVSRVLAKVVGIGAGVRPNQTIYDPTCGSGSLLLKAAEEAPQGLSIFGQEKDGATWALAEMNMILHGYETREIERGDTIASPAFAQDAQLKLHDFVVANPPFSTKSWSSGISPEADLYKRFELGVPPARNGDYAFLLHAIKSLKPSGRGAVIMPHGVLFRGGAEAAIRRNLLKRGLIKGVIGLPPNLFYGTGIPACIVVIDKEGAAERDSVFLIDASKGFVKEGPKNRLRPRDVHKMVDVFTRETDTDRYSRPVPIEEIAEANGYNLNIPRYIDSSEPEDVQDLDAHLNGGIPDRDIGLLGEYWDAFPALRGQLFESERQGYGRARVETDEVQPTIEANPEFAAFKKGVAETLCEWWQHHRRRLDEIGQGTPPKPIVHELAEDLLARFKAVPLLSSYDVYEQLMVYWGETMQDDVYLVSLIGWVKAAKPRGVEEIGRQSNGKPKYEQPDLVVGSGKSAKKYKMDLVPPGVVIERYFSAEREALDRLKLAAAQATQELDEYVDEHGVEEGLLEDAIDDNGKLTKKTLLDRIEQVEDEPELQEELAALNACLRLLDAQTRARKAVKKAERDLFSRVVDSYGGLSEDEIKSLVIDGKWLKAIEAATEARVRGMSHRLTDRYEQLARRYNRTLVELEDRVSELQEQVDGFLETVVGRLDG
jgi:type I restriction enzyme M protein